MKPHPLFLRALAATGIAAGLALVPADAAPPGRGTAIDVPPPLTPPDDMVVTHGRVATGTRVLNYTVRAGTIPILDDDTGRLEARMFITAYTVARTAGSPKRPITFIWNGGPGSNSSQVHLMGFGPKGFRTAPTYPEWKGEPTRIGDRPETWLGTSDLVFVDPIGTGYSRALTPSDRDRLYTTFGDAEAVAEMIRIYRTRYDAFDQPLFIAGESYGTTRAMFVAEALARRGTPVAGVMLMSGDYDTGQKVPPALAKALHLTLFTAIAWYHRLLPADLQELTQEEAVRRAEDWARQVYAPALAQIDRLGTGERKQILDGLQHYTGLSESFIDQKTLTIANSDFSDHLLAQQGLELGRYDGRVTGSARASGQPWSPRSDPSLTPMIGLMEGTSPALIRYLRDTLGYRSDLLYHGPWGGGFHPQPLKPIGPGFDDWMTFRWDRGAEGHASATAVPPLKAAMLSEPNMLVFSILGLYDSSCAERQEEVARTDPALRERVRTACYQAGHMVYTDRNVRVQLQRDFARFVADGVAAGHKQR